MQDTLSNKNERECAKKIRQSIEKWIMYKYPYKNLIERMQNKMQEFEYSNLPNSDFLKKTRIDRLAAMKQEIKKGMEMSLSIDIERIEYIKKFMEEHKHITSGNCTELYNSLSASLYWFIISLQTTNNNEIIKDSYNYEKFNVDVLKKIKEKFLNYFEEVQFVNQLQGRVEISPEKLLQGTKGSEFEIGISNLFTPSINEIKKIKSNTVELIKYAIGASEEQKSMVKMVTNNFKDGENGIDAWLKELNRRVQLHNAEELQEVSEARILYEEALILFNALPKRVLSIDSYRKKFDLFLSKYHSFVDKCKVVFMILENNKLMQQEDSKLRVIKNERK